MEFTLEQVDEVRERTGASYGEAKEALEKTNGDVLEAIIHLESKGEGKQKKSKSSFSDKSNEIMEKLKEIIRKGNVTRIYLKKNGETVMNIPVTAGAIGAIIFAPATIAGILAALATGCRLEIVKDDGEIIDIQNMTEDALHNVKEKVDLARERLTKKNKKEEDHEDDIDIE